MQRTFILATMAALTVTSFSADAATRKRSGRTASAAERSATADLNRKSLEQASMAAPAGGAGAGMATGAMTPPAAGATGSTMTPPAGDPAMSTGATPPMSPGADNMAPGSMPGSMPPAGAGATAPSATPNTTMTPDSSMPMPPATPTTPPQ